MKKKINSGFTVIELLLVMAIIAILSTISFSSYMATIVKGRDVSRKSDLSQIRKALENFNQQFGSYPKADDATHKILGCLNSKPGDSKNPTFEGCPANNGAFEYYVNGVLETPIQKFPIDPVGTRSYYYEQPDSASSDTSSYALYAALENIQDKDVKHLSNGSVDTAGWGKQCGSSICNYKVSNSGLETK